MRRALVAAVIALGACADSGAELPPHLTCTAASDCADGLTCSFNHCVVPAANHLVLAARIIPPPPSGLLTQQIPELSLDEGPDRLVQLLAPKIVRGTVRPEGNPLVTNLEGQVDVTTEGDILGLDFTFSARSLDGLDTEGYGYSLALLPGRDYTGSFRPTDDSLPRYVFELRAADIETGRFDITLPAREDYLKLSGRVMKSDYTAISGARVFVLSYPSNEVAAVTTSAEDSGRWVVLVPPGLTTFSIKTESPADQPFPEFTTEKRDYVAGQSIDVIVPDLPPGTEPIEAVIHVTERKGGTADLAPAVVPAAGRTVTIVGVLAGGTLRRTGTTDHDGVVTFHALPGAYECLVASPPQAAAATWHGFVNLVALTDAVTPETIELVPRVPFVGHLTDAYGEPVEAGTLTLERRLDPKGEDELVIAPAPFEATLGPDGVFVTAVDPGVYDLLVAPDPATGAPHAFETEIVVGAEGLQFDLGLPEPGLLHLTVAGPDGAWIAGTQVELWIDDESGHPRLLAVGSTGDDGFVDLLVPHL